MTLKDWVLIGGTISSAMLALVWLNDTFATKKELTATTERLREDIHGCFDVFELTEEVHPACTLRGHLKDKEQ